VDSFVKIDIPSCREKLSVKITRTTLTVITAKNPTVSYECCVGPDVMGYCGIAMIGVDVDHVECALCQYRCDVFGSATKRDNRVIQRFTDYSRPEFMKDIRFLRGTFEVGSGVSLPPVNAVQMATLGSYFIADLDG